MGLYLWWSAGPADAGSPAWPCTAAHWPRRTAASSPRTHRLPQHLGKRDALTCCPHPAAPPLPLHTRHTPSSTMRSPSFREAPCPAQVLFIWATLALLPRSVSSSWSLAAGLQTQHTTATAMAEATGSGSASVNQGRPRGLGTGTPHSGVADMIKVLGSGSKSTPKFTPGSNKIKSGHISNPAIDHLEINIKTQCNSPG